MTELVKISVIVPTFNREDYLASAVRSVIEQSRAPHEVIVVDDGSDYNVTDYLERHALAQCRVITLENGGKPRAVNAALESVTGTHVWVFDDDDLADKFFLEKVSVALADSSADYAYGWHYAGRSSLADEIPVTETRRPVFEGSGLSDFATLLWGCSIAHNATVASLHAYRALGGMDETFPCSEDYEFQLRLAAGFKGVFVDAPAFIRRMHDGVRGSSAFAYAARDRRRRFLEQDRRFICNWLKRVSITDLPAPPQLSKTRERQAATLADSSLFAFAVAARVGAWQEALAFLGTCCSEWAATSGPTVQEKRFVEGTIRWSDQEVIEGLSEQLASAKQNAPERPLSNIASSIRRGLVVRSLDALKRGQIRDASDTLATALRA